MDVCVSWFRFQRNDAVGGACEMSLVSVYFLIVHCRTTCK